MLLALAFVATLLFIGYSLSPGSGSAQETSGEEGTPTPSVEVSGKLKASRTSVGLGDTTEVTAYDISPAGTGIRLVVSGPLRHGSCDGAEDSVPQSLAILFEPPVSVDLIACGPVGVATVRLETLGGQELANLSITVQETTPPFSLDELFESATTTDDDGQTGPQGASSTSTLSLPPAPSLSATVLYQKDLLVEVTPISGIGKWEFGGRYSSSGTLGPSDEWVYAELAATWTSNGTAEDVACGAYELKMRAIGDGVTYREDWGPWSETVEAKVLCKPPAPANLSVSKASEDSVSVSWTQVSGIGEYQMAYADVQTEVIREVSFSSRSSYILTGIMCGVLYYYAIQARGDGVTYRDAWGSIALDGFTLECSTPADTPTRTATLTQTATPTAIPTPIPVPDTPTPVPNTPTPTPAPVPDTPTATPTPVPDTRRPPRQLHRHLGLTRLCQRRQLPLSHICRSM